MDAPVRESVPPWLAGPSVTLRNAAGADGIFRALNKKAQAHMFLAHMFFFQINKNKNL